MFGGVLDVIFGPILSLPTLAAIAVFSFLVTMMTTLIYKLVTDQKKMGEIKAKMKDYQNKMREFKDNPEKALGMQKKAMGLNMEYMRHSMKATMYTMIPILIIFSWMNANLAFYPISPSQEFDIFAEFKEGSQGMISLDVTPNNGVDFVTPQEVEIIDGKATWTLRGPVGEYLLSYNYDGGTYEQDLIITNGNKYAPPTKPISDGNLLSGNIVNEKVQPLKFMGIKWGWLGTYIIFSLIIGMSTRKLMGLN